MSAGAIPAARWASPSNSRAIAMNQPPSIKLNWETGAGKQVGIWHTADFFVIRIDSAGYEECKEEKELLHLAEKSPQRYQRDERARWRCPPGEGYAGELG